MADKKKALGRGFEALVDPNRARPQAAAPRETGKTFQVAVEKIRPNRYQPRQRFDETALEALAASIRRDGILQPLAVRAVAGTDQYELIAGERRLRAARAAGLAVVPCAVIETNEQGLGVLSLVENLLREDLNVLDEAEAYQQLIDEFELTQEQISQRVGRSRPHVANTLRLLALPDLVRAYIASGELSAGHGRALLAIDDDNAKIALAQDVVTRGLSVRETEELAKRIAAGWRKRAAAKTAPAHPYTDLAEQLKVRLGTKVQFSGGKSKGTIQIHYFSEEELTRLVDVLVRNS